MQDVLLTSEQAMTLRFCCHSLFPPAAGDWLQGPYVYALYQHYGYKQADIGRLFIAGFGSSMIFGTIVGSLADKRYCGSSLRKTRALPMNRGSTRGTVGIQ